MFFGEINIIWLKGKKFLATINSEGSNNIYESSESIVKQTNGSSKSLRPVFTKTIKGQKLSRTFKNKAIAFTKYKFSLTCFFLAGENAKFDIQVKERVSAVQWLKDNKPLDDVLADRILIKEEANNIYSLELLRCVQSDTGLYTAKGSLEEILKKSFRFVSYHNYLFFFKKLFSI